MRIIKTVEELHEYERDGVRIDGPLGFIWWVDGRWISRDMWSLSAETIIDACRAVFVSYDPEEDR